MTGLEPAAGVTLIVREFREIRVEWSGFSGLAAVKTVIGPWKIHQEAGETSKPTEVATGQLKFSFYRSLRRTGKSLGIALHSLFQNDLKTCIAPGQIFI